MVSRTWWIYLAKHCTTFSNPKLRWMCTALKPAMWAPRGVRPANLLLRRNCFFKTAVWLSATWSPPTRVVSLEATWIRYAMTQAQEAKKPAPSAVKSAGSHHEPPLDRKVTAATECVILCTQSTIAVDICIYRQTWTSVQRYQSRYRCLHNNKYIVDMYIYIKYIYTYMYMYHYWYVSKPLILYTYTYLHASIFVSV